jgi:hypothetical protein
LLTVVNREGLSLGIGDLPALFGMARHVDRVHRDYSSFVVYAHGLLGAGVYRQSDEFSRVPTRSFVLSRPETGAAGPPGGQPPRGGSIGPAAPLRRGYDGVMGIGEFVGVTVLGVVDDR